MEHPDSGWADRGCLRPATSPAATDRLIEQKTFLHRFCLLPARGLVIRTYETPTGTRYTRATAEAWKGL